MKINENLPVLITKPFNISKYVLHRIIVQAVNMQLPRQSKHYKHFYRRNVAPVVV